MDIGKFDIDHGYGDGGDDRGDFYIPVTLETSDANANTWHEFHSHSRDERRGWSGGMWEVLSADGTWAMEDGERTESGPCAAVGQLGVIAGEVVAESVCAAVDTCYSASDCEAAGECEVKDGAAASCQPPWTHDETKCLRPADSGPAERDRWCCRPPADPADPTGPTDGSCADGYVQVPDTPECYTNGDGIVYRSTRCVDPNENADPTFVD